jgi:predicted O-methyltransferase YrrM
MEIKGMKTLQELFLTPRMNYSPMQPDNSVEGLNDMCLEIMQANFIVVEVGSFSGVSSDLLARYCNTLYCIDVWTYPIFSGFNKDILRDAFGEFLKVAKEHDNITYYNIPSLKACEMFQDNSIDVVYIDAIHEYEHCCRDIQAWYDKVKYGGYITGHDYCKSFPGVVQAVDELLGKPKVYKDSSWMIKKV